MSHYHNWILPDGSNLITPEGDNYVTPEFVLHLVAPAGRIAWVPWSEVTAFVDRAGYTVQVPALDLIDPRVDAAHIVEVQGEDRTVYVQTADSEAEAEE